MTARRILLFALISLFLISALTAQQLDDAVMPEEYQPEEFPVWAHDLRRFEVISVGSFPMTFLLSSLIYDFAVYASNDFDASFSMGSQRDNDDIAIIMSTAAGLSLALGTVDLAINVSKRNKARAAAAPSAQ